MTVAACRPVPTRRTRTAFAVLACSSVLLSSGCTLGGAARPPAASVVASVRLEGSPIFLAMAPDGNRLFAAAGDRLSVLDTEPLGVAATIAIAPHAAGIAVSADGDRVYVSHLFNDHLTVFHTGARAVSERVDLVGDRRPGGWGRIAVHPDRSLAFVANHEREDLGVVDLTARDAGVLSPGMRPRDIAVSADGATAYVCGCPGFCSTGAIRIFDTVQRRFSGKITVGANPYRIVLAPDGTRAYTANLGGATVSVIDLATWQLVTDLPAPAGPTGLAVSPDGSRLYVAGNTSGEVAAFDTASLTEVGRLHVADKAREIALSRDGRHAFVATQDGILLLDTAEFEPRSGSATGR